MFPRSSTVPLLFVCVAAACETMPSAVRASANQKREVEETAGQRLTIDALFDPASKVDFNGKPKTKVNWIGGNEWLESRTNKDTKKSEWFVVDAQTGDVKPFAEMARAAQAIAGIPGVDQDDVAKLAAPDLERMTQDRKALFVVAGKDLWVLSATSDAAVRITNTPDVDEEEITFSPDGKHVAFVAANDLYVGDAVNGGATAITKDGSATVLNGKLDWLYQEEVFGRGTFRSYWWSPDSKTIAFLRLDETGVPPYTLVDDSHFVPKVETSAYPRPGEPNPTAKLGLANVAAPVTHFVDTSAFAAEEPLIVDVSWSPKNEVVYSVQNREQTWLELRTANADGSNDRKLLRETSPAWVERNDQSPMWLADGSFLWLSERTGFKHLYHYRGAELVGALTSGEWEARTLHGVDEKKGVAYFSGTERSAIGSDAYSVGLDGKGLKRLTDRAGTHTVTFSTDFSYFVDAWSDVWTPTQVRLMRADGTLVRVLDENKVETIARYATSKPELLTVKTRDGFEMNAMLIKPLGFDPKRRYPVMMFVYSGPHSQTVKNAWGGTTGMYQQMLAQMGVVVWSCDNRTASGKGLKSAWPCYMRLGESELADIEDSIAWLKSQGFVDETRVGISGWSYGGFMTSYALTHSKTFSLGIAGGSVTDWRMYDSIYTERLMRLPKNNEKGYDETSVVKSADKLHGKLVLVHGQLDDNVHPQNTLRLARALQEKNADFDLMLYPRSRHGLGEPLLVRHWRTLMMRAIVEQWLARPPIDADS